MSHWGQLGDKIGHVRRRNDGTILSIWISINNQKMLFLPEHPELIGEEE
jgi:hypothetical protein